ncbi:PP2C family protein-serine/threonine phosphatase, partial [Micromonospora sp. LOL_025]|uniref:PP2C family protein-serine/threonine phosphatase n=1 Tax=Micromonospora sp. LOL_025 TaxID=3345413 RepID=UPI003A886D78
LIGGDFYDVVQTRPDRLDLIVGDVCGHGVDEAALGVELRVAWRALILAGVPDDEVLPALEQVLISERSAGHVFTSVCAIAIDLTGQRATIRSAGHPPPLLLHHGTATPVAAHTGLLLGVAPRQPATTNIPLPHHDWSLLLYTDGLIEGHIGQGKDRLDVDGLAVLPRQVGRGCATTRRR